MMLSNVGFLSYEVNINYFISWAQDCFVTYPSILAFTSVSRFLKVVCFSIPYFQAQFKGTKAFSPVFRFSRFTAMALEAVNGLDL